SCSCSCRRTTATDDCGSRSWRSWCAGSRPRARALPDACRTCASASAACSGNEARWRGACAGRRARRRGSARRGLAGCWKPRSGATRTWSNITGSCRSSGKSCRVRYIKETASVSSFP
ncbi:unnamed protein product, partial [Gulo gulo]